LPLDKKSFVLIVAVIALFTLTGCGGGASSSSSSTTPAAHNEWTWVAGSNLVNQAGTYATQGTASANNIPGARDSASSWTDSSGNFWLFGGEGVDSAGNSGLLNDLWKFNGSQWTWVGGSNLVWGLGSYGTIGQPSSSNFPDSRESAANCTDSSGNLWLFGGTMYNNYHANDLWEYSTNSGEWTWMSGSNGANSPQGVYGTQGTAAASNVPGGRYSANCWTDSSGNFWLFGGRDNGGVHNDLWKFSPSSGEWTWISGSNMDNQAGIYGTQGTAASSNVPGAREGDTYWTDSTGNFWLFGGAGYDSNGSLNFLNDLWKFNPSSAQWTWVSGSNAIFQTGVYGTQGTASSSNIPGARGWAQGWTDRSGNFWIFGGWGLDSTGAPNIINDLWEYSGGKWIWIGGSKTIDHIGIYGMLGVTSSSNIPGARSSAVSWTDKSGNLWLFGGDGYATSSAADLNDLWEYQP